MNSNYLVDTERGRRFLRIYEEQSDPAGVAYEWALLDHLANAGIPVPRVVSGTQPGQLQIAGKPTALFELVGGTELCFRQVADDHIGVVGDALGRIHAAVSSFPERREGRFGLSGIRERLDAIEAHQRPGLVDAVARLRDVCDEVESELPTDLPRGVIHGDLFRDNVRWEGTNIAAIVDWESASDDLFILDLMVTMLAWCYGDDFQWDRAQQLVGAYTAQRPLSEAEQHALRLVGMYAAARFTATRITDFHLRSEGLETTRDYRRFLARLESITALRADELADKLIRDRR